jgi:hypothetical protein
LGIQFACHGGMGRHHVGLAGEDDTVRAGGEGQFFRADAVQGQEDAFLAPVQHGQGEVAVDVLRRVAAMPAPQGDEGRGGGQVFEFR